MAINCVNHGDQKLNLRFRCKPRFGNIPHSSFFLSAVILQLII